MNKILLMSTLALLVIIGGVYVYQNNTGIENLKDRNSSLQSSIDKTNDEIAANSKLALGAAHESYSFRRLLLEPASDKLIMPELKMKVPYSPEARSLLYTIRSNPDNTESQEIDVLTDQFVPPQESTTLNCTNFLRLKIEDKQNPYNPAEKPTSFKLNDGRTLQVYYFTGELEGNDECKKLYEAQNIAPKDFVKTFSAASSY